MNKLQAICVSLEWAKELKKAGYPQESLFYWSVETTSKELLKTLGVKRWKPTITDSKKEMDGDVSTEKIAAPTSTEIGEELPREIETTWRGRVIYHPGTNHFENSDTEANARAKCLLYLLKNGIIKSNEL